MQQQTCQQLREENDVIHHFFIQAEQVYRGVEQVLFNFFLGKPAAVQGNRISGR